jgi:hypothetical protein
MQTSPTPYKRKEEGGRQLASWRLPAAGKENQKINLADKAGVRRRSVNLQKIKK